MPVTPPTIASAIVAPASGDEPRARPRATPPARPAATPHAALEAVDENHRADAAAPAWRSRRRTRSTTAAARPCADNSGTSPAPGTSHRASRSIARASAWPGRSANRRSAASVPSSCSASAASYRSSSVAGALPCSPSRTATSSSRATSVSGASVRRGARVDVIRRRQRTGVRDLDDVADKLVAVARDRAYELRRLRPVAQRPPDRANGLAERAVGDDDIGPDAIEDSWRVTARWRSATSSTSRSKYFGMSRTGRPSLRSTRCPGERTNVPNVKRTRRMLTADYADYADGQSDRSSANDAGREGEPAGAAASPPVGRHWILNPTIPESKCLL